MPLVKFAPDDRNCPCGGERKVLKTHHRIIATLAIGQILCHETITKCDKCRGAAHSEQLRRLVPQGGKFGFDIIIHIGRELYLHSRSDLEIQSQLVEKNIPISVREIGYLGVKFITYLAIAHKCYGSHLN